MPLYRSENLQAPFFESPFCSSMAGESNLARVDFELVRRFEANGIVVFDPGVGHPGVLKRALVASLHAARAHQRHVASR